MELLCKWNQLSLVKRILIGLILGAVLGFLLPGASFLSLLGTLFVGALKALAPLLVFFLVLHSLAQHKKGAKSNMSTVIALYLIGTLLAALCAVVASFLFPSTLALAQEAASSAPGGIGEILQTLLNNAVSNPISAMAEANYIGVLLWAVVFGIALRDASDRTKQVLGDLSDALSTAIRWVISCAPFGILGLVFTTVSETGFSSFMDYGRLLCVLAGCMFFVALIVNPILVFLCIRRNPYPLVFRCLKESGIMAFFTRSSAANIPVNLRLCKELGLDEEKYSVSIPLGATINMAGAAITISVLTLAAANTLGISVDFPTAFLLSVVASIAACGSSGVAGGSLLLIPMACSLFGIPNDIAMQVVGIGFIIGVVQDSCETALNSSSDVLFTAAAEFRSRRLALLVRLTKYQKKRLDQKIQPSFSDLVRREEGFGGLQAAPGVLQLAPDRHLRRVGQLDGIVGGIRDVLQHPRQVDAALSHVQPPAPGHAHHVRVVHRRDEGRTVAQVDEAESLRRYLPQLFWGDLHPVGVQSVHQHLHIGPVHQVHPGQGFGQAGDV